jgi:hypothetical protein
VVSDPRQMVGFTALPKLRTEFLVTVKPNATEAEEKQILWELMGLRKRKELSKLQK